MAKSEPTSRSHSAKQAWATRRSPKYKADRIHQRSKEALASWCRTHGWKVLFFEGQTGAPRTGIVDAIMVRIRRNDADAIDIGFVQLKAGAGGLTAREIARLKKATRQASLGWLLATFDGKTVHILTDTITP